MLRKGWTNSKEKEVGQSQRKTQETHEDSKTERHFQEIVSRWDGARGSRKAEAQRKGEAETE